MKIYFMKEKAVEYLKENMKYLYINYYCNDDNSWIEKELGYDPFVFFEEIPDFEMASLLNKKAGEIDMINCKIIYEKLKNLSESQASDERLWAGLCNGTFYKYLRRRFGYSNGIKESDKINEAISNTKARFFFSGGIRSGCYGNAISKCWWVGRAAYDVENINNHFEMLDTLDASDFSTKVHDIFYSNTFAASPSIFKGICAALKFYSDRGIKLITKKEIRPAVRYLNVVGGVKLLDALTEEEVKSIMINKIAEYRKGKKDVFQKDTKDDSELDIDSDDDEFEYSVNNEFNNINENNIYHLAEYAEQNDNIALKDKPQKVGYGCKVSVYKKEDDKMMVFHIPLKSDNTRELYLIEKKMLDESIGYEVFSSGAHFKIVDIDWD